MVHGIVPLINTQPPTPPTTQEGSLESSPVDTEDTHSPDEEAYQPPLPNRARVHVSDNDQDSPWSRKMILSLDGGGVKGYSSLLIVKRLMSLIMEIEQGLRPKHELPLGRTPSADDYWEPNDSSGDYPWYRSMERPLSASRSSSRAKVSLNTDDIERSVAATFDEEDKVKAYKPYHYFDYIAGTSTGGLSAIMLGRMQLDIDKALEQYDTVGNEVFGKPRPLHIHKFADFLAPKYGPKQMERAIQDVIETGLAGEMKQYNNEEPYTKDKIQFLSNPMKCRTIVVAHGLGNKAYETSYLFRTYDHPHPPPLSERDDIRDHKNPGPAHMHEIWKIARATSAAPKYFSSIDIGDRIFRDGGMGANNPAFLALKEVRQMHAQTPRLLLSVGTGRPKEKDNVTRAQGPIRDWVNVVGLLTKLATQSESTHGIVKDNCGALGIHYCRQNVGPSLKEIKLDEWKPSVDGSETKKRILDLTKKHLQTRAEHEKLLRCAEELVQVRRHRACGDRWEAFARDFVYVCEEQACVRRQNAHPFSSRDSLRRHALEEHELVPLLPIQNSSPRYRYACIYDTCSQFGIHIFRSQEAVRRHLRTVHRFKDPQLKSPEEVELWLDRLRMEQTEYLERINSDSTSSTNSPHRETLREGFANIRASLRRPP